MAVQAFAGRGFRLPMDQGQEPMDQGQEPFNPRGALQKYKVGLKECLYAHPDGVRKLIQAYCFELAPTPPRELFGRVEFYSRGEPMNDESRPDTLTFFIAYDKVEKLFRELMELGNEFGCQEFVQNYISQVAHTRFTFCEEPEGVKTYLSHEQSDRHLWHFTIAYNARRDCVLMLDPRRVMPMSIRCDTRFNETPNLSIEQAEAYAPQARDIVKVNEQLASLEIGFIHPSCEADLQQLFNKKLEIEAIKKERKQNPQMEVHNSIRLMPRQEAEALARPRWDVATINFRVEGFHNAVEAHDIDEYVQGGPLSKRLIHPETLTRDDVESVSPTNPSVPRDIQLINEGRVAEARSFNRGCACFMGAVLVGVISVLGNLIYQSYQIWRGPEDRI